VTIWGHYAEFVQQANFALFMAAWCLLALDAWQQARRAERRRKEAAQWKS